MNNYYPDINRFKLAGPPKWWLQALWDFDNSLAVVPSRQGFFYRLAQRRPLSLKEEFVKDMLFKESDTQMLASYGLIPVTTIIATANWDNPFMFEELRRRSPHRMGGAEKVNQMIEAQEKAEELKKASEIDERNEYLTRDAFRYYKMKQGLRSTVFSPKTPNKGYVHGPLLKTK